MRISPKEKEIIVTSVHAMDPHARIVLFGSRTDDTKKGGDIDLIVISNRLSFKDKLHIKNRIFDQMDEQKIDIIISAPGDKDPFVNLAMEKGVEL